jgi:hypothetical protein
MAKKKNEERNTFFSEIPKYIFYLSGAAYKTHNENKCFNFSEKSSVSDHSRREQHT